MNTGKLSFSPLKLASYIKGKDRQMTVGEFAKRVGITPTSVSAWLGGRSIPGDNRIEDMAKVLDVSISALCDQSPGTLDFYVSKIADALADQPDMVKAEALASVLKIVDRVKKQGISLSDEDMDYVVRGRRKSDQDTRSNAG